MIINLYRILQLIFEFIDLSRKFFESSSNEIFQSLKCELPNFFELFSNYLQTL